MNQSIHGYSYGQALGTSPVSLQDFEDMKRSVLFSEEDERWLQKSEPILAPQVAAIVEVWYGFVGSQPHLLKHFSSSGEPDSRYLAQVRARFERWILDTARARYDQAWLDWQHEIALRHHRTKKNQTDEVRSSAIVPMSHLVLLTYPVTFTLRPFLAKGEASAQEVESMHQAWLKSVMLQATLWAQPYVKPGDF